jgi:hypothetical protein
MFDWEVEVPELAGVVDLRDTAFTACGRCGVVVLAGLEGRHDGHHRMIGEVASEARSGGLPHRVYGGGE